MQEALSHAPFMCKISFSLKEKSFSSLSAVLAPRQISVYATDKCCIAYILLYPITVGVGYV